MITMALKGNKIKKDFLESFLQITKPRITVVRVNLKLFEREGLNKSDLMP